MCMVNNTCMTASVHILFCPLHYVQAPKTIALGHHRSVLFENITLIYNRHLHNFTLTNFHDAISWITGLCFPSAAAAAAD